MSRFEDLDLAIFEFSDTDILENLHKLDISLCTSPNEDKDFEYAVLGCHRAVYALNYETKEIVVKKGALITDRTNTRNSQQEFDFSSFYIIAGTQETLTNLKSINE